MEEIWKNIPGLDNRYEASNLGNIRSLNYNKTGAIRVLSKSHYKTGYVRVNIQKQNKSKSMLVHRLVAQAFIPNPENKPEVNHINGDKTDNCISNLEWATGKENVNHFYRVTRRKPFRLKSGRGRDWQRKKVLCVETGIIYPSITSAAKAIGVCDRAISQLLSNPSNRHTAGGYHWKLA